MTPIAWIMSMSIVYSLLSKMISILTAKSLWMISQSRPWCLTQAREELESRPSLSYRIKRIRGMGMARRWTQFHYHILKAQKVQVVDRCQLSSVLVQNMSRSRELTPKTKPCSSLPWVSSNYQLDSHLMDLHYIEHSIASSQSQNFTT